MNTMESMLARMYTSLSTTSYLPDWQVKVVYDGGYRVAVLFANSTLVDDTRYEVYDDAQKRMTKLIVKYPWLICNWDYREN